MSRSRRARSAFVFLLALTLAAPMAQAQTPAEPALAIDAADPALAWGPCPAFLPAGCGIAVLHGDPAKANVDVLFKVPGGSTLPAHSHTSAERMVLVSGELEVTYRGQAAVTLRPGMYAYGPAGVVHEGRCTSTQACVLFIAFEAPLDAIEAKD